MLARWIERHAGLTAVLVLLIVAPLLVWASQEIEGAILFGGPVTVTTDIIVGDDVSVVGDLEADGNVVLGNNATADAITLTGVFSQTGAATFSSTVAVTGAITATGGVTGDVTGDVTGNLLGDAANSVAYKGNLPTASAHTGEFYRNTTGDSLFYATDSAWITIVPK